MSNTNTITNTFNREDFISKELKEMNREFVEYAKIKGFYKDENKRTFSEMMNWNEIIYSPDPSTLPMPSEKLLTKN